eukprot:TRINITY_DN55898_c0_g1_i1.p1 TRINITY_DN55898_c0_g1~~TRINITY_DN55898_c0_g1_i1.p1  ORF type:complete len:478 (-),score=92.02 TRINITY_DN55898_c0_g1_i1:216-1649(-)
MFGFLPVSPLLFLKVNIAFGCFLLAALGAVIPLYLNRPRAISALSVGCAGVFLGAAVAHLLPDAQETLAHMEAKTGFPIASTMMGVGVLTTLILERLVSTIASHNAARRARAVAKAMLAQAVGAPHGSQTAPWLQKPVRSALRKSHTSTPTASAPSAEEHTAAPVEAAHPPVSDDTVADAGQVVGAAAVVTDQTVHSRAQGAMASGRVMRGGELAMMLHADATHAPVGVDFDWQDHREDHHNAEGEEEGTALLGPSAGSGYGAAGDATSVHVEKLGGHSHADGGHGHGGATGAHGHSHGVPVGVVGVSAWMLYLALSLHSVVEGIAVGLGTSVVSLGGLAAALLLHKVLDAAAAGSFMALPIRAHDAIDEAHVHLQDTADHRNKEHQRHRRELVMQYVRRSAVLALMTPIGVVVGTTAGNVLPRFAQGMMQAFASGTFLYVGMMEILARELTDRDLVLRCSLLVSGFAVMSGLALFV